MMKPIRRKIKPSVKFDFEQLDGAPTLVDIAKELLRKSNDRILVSKRLLSRGNHLNGDASPMKDASSFTNHQLPK